MRAAICLILLLTLIETLSSCTAGLSIASSGAQAIYNRNALQKKLSDHYITMQANRKIYIETDRYKDSHISVSTFNNEVLLTGEVTHASKRKEIERKIQQIDGVNKVYNLTTVSTPSPPLIQISDTWITAKIKAKLIATNEVDPDIIKVVTENGIVYLMGILPPEQANSAVQIARTTDGVQSVVRVFYYLRISKI